MQSFMTRLCSFFPFLLSLICGRDVKPTLFTGILIIVLLLAEADGALDKARKHKKRQLEDTLNLVMKKRKVVPCFNPYSML